MRFYSKIYKFLSRVWIIFLITGCFGDQDFFKQEKTEITAVELHPLQTEEGLYSSFVNANLNDDQIIKISDENLGNAEIMIPAGALAISTGISVQEGISLTTNSLHQELGLADDTKVQGSGTAINISTDSQIDMSKPMTLALSLPSVSSLHLAESELYLTIIYAVIKHDAGGAISKGALANDEISVRDGKAYFNTKYFGTFQVVYLTKPIEQKKEIAVSESILTKREEKKIPEVGWEIATPLLSSNSISLSARLIDHQELSRCALFFDQDKQAPWDHTEVIKAPGNHQISIKAIWAGKTFFANFECIESNGRVIRSQWSQAITLPVLTSQTNETLGVKIIGGTSPRVLFNLPIEYQVVFSSPILGTSFKIEDIDFEVDAAANLIKPDLWEIEIIQEGLAYKIKITESSQSGVIKPTIAAGRVFNKSGSISNIKAVFEGFPTAYQIQVVNPSVTLSINSGATYTNDISVDLTLGNASQVEKFEIANTDSSCQSVSWSKNWQTYIANTPINHSLTDGPDGNRIVCVKTSNSDETLTTVIEQSIILDQTDSILSINAIPSTINPNSTIGSETNFNGMISDAVAGVATLEISFQNTSQNVYLSSTGFDSNSQVWHNVTYSSGWTFSVDDSLFADTNEYEIMVRATDQAGNQTTTSASPFTWSSTPSNTPPTLVINEPSGNNDAASVGETYSITFSASDPDDDATVSFYYKTSNTDCSPSFTGWTSLDSNVPENNTSVVWNLSSVGIGSYYICAVITDGVNTQYSLSNSTLRVTGPAFISQWDTTKPGISSTSQIRLPLVNHASSAYDFIVDWGDSTSDHITSYNQPEATHTYPGSGTYTVKIRGTLTGWQFNNAGDSQKLINISQWGPFKFGNASFYLAGASNLTITATDTPDLSGTTSFQGMFKGCSTLNNIPNLGTWNTSGITNMASIFQNATAFNQDLSSWDVMNVINMSGMFLGAAAFNQNIGSWDVSNVTNMTNMFQGAMAFNQNIGNWNVSNVTNMSSMFKNALAFNAPLDNWNVEQVSNMSYMFYGATSFNQSLSNWQVSQVTAMNGMLDNSGMSTQNYDSLLISWSKQSPLGTISFGAAGLKHSGGYAGSRRQFLQSGLSWTITDAGQSTTWPSSSDFIEATNITGSSFEITWGPAFDPDTAPANLSYFVCSASNPLDIDTVDECLDHQEMPWTLNTTNFQKTGTSWGSTYHLNVVVRDPENHHSIYRGISVTLVKHIYRSVAVNATNYLVQNTGSLTISGITATFTSSLPSNIGVGDVIRYDGSNLAFISRRISPTTYQVYSAAGTIPASVTSSSSWQVFRAYTSLENAISRQENTGIANDFDSGLGGRNLPANNEVWHIAVYGNSTPDTAPVRITDWTTSEQNYLRIFSPSHPTEAGSNQRHLGTWSTARYRLEGIPQNENDGLLSINGNAKHVRIEGLQIGLSSCNNANQAALGFYPDSTNPHKYIAMGNLIRGGNTATSSQDCSGLAIFETIAGTSGSAAIINNIIYNFNGSIIDVSSSGINLSGSDFNFYVYNNTIFNQVAYGVRAELGSVIAINNISRTSTANYAFVGTYETDSGFNLSSDMTAPGSNPRLNSIPDFVDPGTNFLLASADIVANNLGTDLTNTNSFPFKTDVLGMQRGVQWSIGAHEPDSSKYIKVSSNAYPGDFGGLVAADAICTTDFGSGYKALLGITGERLPGTNWVLSPYTSYKNNLDEIIGTANASGIISNFTDSIDITSSQVWTGLSASWSAYNNCSNWTATGSTGAYTISSKIGTGAIAETSGSCATAKYLYCVEQ